jgi:hypothetical protein
MELRKGKGQNKTKVPAPVIMGEILLTLVIIRYILNFCFYLHIITDEADEIASRAFAMVFSIVMLLLIVSSVIGIASAKPSSWRKVMRTSIILLVINKARDIIGMTGVTIDDTVLIIITALTMIMMMLPSVRRFYLPPMTENPPLTRWIGYIFVMPLFKEADFEFVREGDAAAEKPSSAAPR